MSARDLPDAHVQFVFAAILLRNRLLSARELRREVVAAFGPSTGLLLADQLLASLAPAPAPR